MGDQDADLTVEAVERVARSASERLEYECLGAWRAGFDWLVVVDPLPTAAFDGEPTLSITRYYIPTDYPVYVRRAMLETRTPGRMKAYGVGALTREAVEAWQGADP